MYKVDKTKGEFVAFMKDSTFYCLKRERCFRFKHHMHGAIKIPIDKTYYGSAIQIGFGWWQDKIHTSTVQCIDGTIQIKNKHNKPTQYENV